MISVVVPVYKAEAYLRDCIRSILRQSYSDYELILVDDGSPDRSGEICDRFAKQDKRVTVIHQENGGVSKARNVGIDAARGEWICFIDADDLVLKDFLAAFEPDNQRGVDLVIQGMLDMEAKRIKSSRSFPDSPPLVGREFLTHEILNFCGPMCKLFRTSIIKDHDIRFPIGLPYGEDSIFYYAYLNACSYIRTRSARKYIYRRDNADSASHKVYDPTLIMDYLEESLRHLHSLYESRGLASPYPKSGGINVLKGVIASCFFLKYRRTQYAELVSRIRKSKTLRLNKYHAQSPRERLFITFLLRAPISLQYMLLNLLSIFRRQR